MQTKTHLILKKIILLLVICGMFSPLPVKTYELSEQEEQQYQEALQEYDQHFYLKTSETFETLARKGHAASQFNLGWMYLNGQGIRQDNEEAVHWYRKAAKQGHVEAQINLGTMLANGQSAHQDYEEATFWYQKAAEQDNAEAQFRLGVSYAIGEGVQKDSKKALYWYHKAAEQGHEQAQLNLASRYAKGHGTQQDEKQAAFWYRKAAAQGNADAQYNLGAMYDRGRGVQQHYKEAAFWYHEAAKQGNAEAQFNFGLMYAEGRGVHKDDKEASYWINKAAEQGNVDAQFILGVEPPINRQDDKQLISNSQSIQQKKHSPLVSPPDSTTNQDTLLSLLEQFPPTIVNKKRWLFVIGIENYDNTDHILYSKKSAKTFAQVASKTLGIHPSRMVVLLDKRATSGAIQDNLRLMLRKVREDDEIYFYYSGHGLPIPEEDNAAYILPSDKIPDFIAADKFYKTESIYRMLENSRAKSVIAFMDSCFTGQVDGKSVFKGEKAATRLQPKKIGFPENGKVAIITAGTDKQFSNAYKEKEHRLFSYYLMHAMLSGKYKDVGKLAERVRADVYDKSLDFGGLNEQSPVFTGNPNLSF